MPGSAAELQSNLLIEEINHRWFNALQVLNSTVRRLVRETPSDADLKDVFEPILEQITAIATLQRHLSVSPSADTNLGDYCRTLCDAVLSEFKRHNVSVEVKVDDVQLSPERGLLLGLLVVELMTNELKHGNAPAEGGHIIITMAPSDNSAFEMVVRDNFQAPYRVGGIPRIVAALVKSINGALFIEQVPTYSTRILIPREVG